jgi:hypothetical protein
VLLWVGKNYDLLLKDDCVTNIIDSIISIFLTSENGSILQLGCAGAMGAIIANNRSKNKPPGVLADVLTNFLQSDEECDIAIKLIGMSL